MVVGLGVGDRDDLMPDKLYAQLVHLSAILVVGVLVGLGRMDTNTGVALISGLVGIALPSPFQRPEMPPKA